MSINETTINPTNDFSIAKINQYNEVVSIQKEDVVCVFYNDSISVKDSVNYKFIKSQVEESILDQLDQIQKSEKEFSKFGDIAIFFPKNFSKICFIKIKETKINEIDFNQISSKILINLKNFKTTHFILQDESNEQLSQIVKILMEKITLNTYAFNKYKNFSSDQIFNYYSNKKLDLNLINSTCILKTYANYGPNDLYPISYGKSIQNLLEPLGVKVTILDSNKLQELGMDSIYSVGKGSIQKPCAVIMEWNNGNTPKLGFVGKGVTFDTGGISIKPSNKMDEMKFDMSGSAVVVGLMHLIASSKMPINAVCAVGLAENMPSGEAMRPGDVISSMSGQTIEVLNTDAEGRLVLADILWYIQEKCEVKNIIDLATLTGAVVVSLGSEYAGLFSNNENLAEEIYKSSIESEEKVWKFPLSKEYDKLMDSKIAHMKNISSGSGAGSITAAQFLQRFIQKDTKWAHIDIAGVAYKSGFSTGFGLKLLYNWINKNHLN